jgi:hypothetical protein
MEFGNVTWERSLAGGEISEFGIRRNYRRVIEGKEIEDDQIEGPEATMELALRHLGYKVVVAANPTNPKEKGAGENKMQLADLFLVNEYWPTAMGGIVTPDDAKLKQVDTRKLSATATLTKISDHAPVAMIASTVPNDPDVHGAFRMPQSASAQIAEMNQNAWERMRERLLSVWVQSRDDDVAVKKQMEKIKSVNKQIEKIKSALWEPLLSTEEEAGVLGLVRALRESIQNGPNEDLDPEQKKAMQEALRDLREWTRPYYVTDISNSPD